MIDLEKEREALVNEIELFIRESMECFVVEVWADSYASIDSAFSHHITSDGEVFFLREQARQLWEFWKKRAEPAQAEITELKQKLEKIESGEFVLVPTSDLQTWYLDEYEGLWLDKDGIDGGLSEIDIGEVSEVKKQKQYSIKIPSVFVTLPWIDGEVGEWQEYATKEEAEKVAKHCKQMFDADGV
ncbi:hypothetical protein [Acinetobacter pollinis]|uniref:hypothetical protein n=1 Tax=Acinetobacter pollinis TaxID=2605270 RepID=UPI0018C2702C|nr:hypothetical protein [Acinetobacter pollinis]MBF7693908.1 hypothetical protein [Acinetobacter pollinis]MBF7701584.1 hypothetical protein [Acinetobacter pollinis]